MASSVPPSPSGTQPPHLCAVEQRLHVCMFPSHAATVLPLLLRHVAEHDAKAPVLRLAAGEEEVVTLASHHRKVGQHMCVHIRAGEAVQQLQGGGGTDSRGRADAGREGGQRGCQRGQ